MEIFPDKLWIRLSSGVTLVFDQSWYQIKVLITDFFIVIIVNSNNSQNHSCNSIGCRFTFEVTFENGKDDKTDNLSLFSHVEHLFEKGSVSLSWNILKLYSWVFWVDSVGILHLNISITAVFIPSYPVDYIHSQTNKETLHWNGSIQLSRVIRVRGS